MYIYDISYVVTFYYCTDIVHVSNRICAIDDGRVILHEDSRSELTGGELKCTAYKLEALTKDSSYKSPVREEACYPVSI